MINEYSTKLEALSAVGQIASVAAHTLNAYHASKTLTKLHANMINTITKMHAQI